MIDAPEGELNIKDFVIDNPRKGAESSFSLTRGISPERWDEINDRISRVFNENVISKPEVVALIPFALIASKENRPVVTDENWDKMKSKLLQASDVYKFRIALAMKLLAPERYQQEELIDNDEWEDFRYDFVRTQSDDERDSALAMKAVVKLLDPEKADEFILEDRTWESIKAAVDASKNVPNIDALAEMLANIKIVDLKKSEEMGITDEDWASIWKMLENPMGRGKVSTLLYIEQVGSLAILAAKDIKIDENGVRLIMPSSLQNLDPKPKMPELRNF